MPAVLDDWYRKVCDASDAFISLPNNDSNKMVERWRDFRYPNFNVRSNRPSYAKLDS